MSRVKLSNILQRGYFFLEIQQVMNKKNRRVGSIKNELLKKSREAAFAAVQTFNNPTIKFKSESYIVLMVIAWRYLLHAYFKKQGIEYRCFQKGNKRRKFEKTKYGAQKYIGLTECLNHAESPIDKNTTNNLKFLMDLRNEIEHGMTNEIDVVISAKFQACCLNYNRYLKELFGDNFGIEKDFSMSIQFSAISPEQVKDLKDYPGLPPNIQSYIKTFEEGLSDEEFSDSRYAYRVIFTRKTANHKGQADRVIEFIPSDSKQEKSINEEYAVIKETEKEKYLPGQIVKMMKEEGFSKFSMHNHTQLWKELDAKNLKKNYGVSVAGKWHWYESWINEVRRYCEKNREDYSR